MADPKENIRQIGESISSHALKEQNKSISNKAFARATCTLSPTLFSNPTITFWLTNQEDYQGYRETGDFTGSGTVVHLGHRTALQPMDGKSIYKNTLLGEVLTKYVSGIHKYKAPKGEITVNIHNRSTYHPNGYDPLEVEIRIDGEPAPFRYQKLSHLLDVAKAEENRLKQQQDELKRLEEERLGLERELEERKAKEEKEKLEILRKEKEEEERKSRETLAKIEQKIADTLEKEKAVRSFMRKNAMLRSQHLLDEYQEDAKRSHIFDGVPIVIDGGPGTGKTTTMIQRLKFLLSYQSLEEYGAPLSKKQIEDLTNPQERDNHWLFFSPTDMLLQYLRANMQGEGLHANDRNTRTITKFRNKAMRDYKLFNPSKDGPFKDYKISEGEEILIQDTKGTIDNFERYIIDYCNKIFSQRVDLETSNHIWHEDAVKIKDRCKNSGRIKDIDGLMNLFNSLQENEKYKIKIWSEELNEYLKASAIKLQRLIQNDLQAIESLKKLFERWRKERLGIEDGEEDDAIIIDDDDENEEISFSKQEFDTQLFQELKKLLKQLGLKKFGSIKKIPKRNQEVLDIIKDFIKEDELEIEYIGSIALFVRNYASLCRGIESNIIGIIPRLYKTFRKEQTKGTIYNSELLQNVIKKDSNKHLHPDEQNLLLGFINEMLHRIYKRSRTRFSNLKHKYAQSFKENVRNVIGVDEATDYSLLDYYFMISFRHYEFASITLCGDLMQGLNFNGINDWDEIRKFNLPNLEVKSLNISYRQLPTLLDMARELYYDVIGVYPSYNSQMERAENEPKPLLLASDDDWEKAEWISYRIRDILDIYNELPSIAIFVGDEVNIAEFIERINDLDLLNGIEIVDCSGDKQLQNKEMIRVFRLSEVKGMEFEAAFFYDIDEALSSHNEQLMRRYLYVGISRATSHLAATLKNGNDSKIVKYFDRESDSWEI